MAHGKRGVSCWLTLAFLLLPFSYAAPILQEQIILSSNANPKSNQFNHNGKHSFTLNMTFDSIDLTKTVNRTLTSLPYMVFTGYEVVNTTAAAENGYLDAGDINSATSKPNAIHSIARDFPTVSNFRSNATALAAINVTEFFDLVSFAVKPLGPAEAYSYMLVDAYEIGSKGIENWHSLALGWGEQTGFLQPVQLEPREYFPGWGEKVNWVEIEARSDDNEPMEFCVDDIVLDFKERTASED